MKEDEAVALKPCPFCKAIVYPFDHSHTAHAIPPIDYYSINHSPDCFLFNDGASEYTRIPDPAAWNLRAYDPQAARDTAASADGQDDLRALLDRALREGRHGPMCDRARCVCWKAETRAALKPAAPATTASDEKRDWKDLKRTKYRKEDGIHPICATCGEHRGLHIVGQVGGLFCRRRIAPTADKEPTPLPPFVCRKCGATDSYVTDHQQRRACTMCGLIEPAPLADAVAEGDKKLAQQIYDALAVNDDINTWHKERILPMIAAIAASAIAAAKRRDCTCVEYWHNPGDHNASCPVSRAIAVNQLEQAIRKHRDQRGDDRCWMDDEELYKVLPEGYTPPARDAGIEIQNCERFIQSRKHPATEYVSPQREIERLTTALAAAKRDVWEQAIKIAQRTLCDYCEEAVDSNDVSPAKGDSHYWKDDDGYAGECKAAETVGALRSQTTKQ